MKPFKSYQYVGGEMTDRDKQEVGSKFWNEGKWENFVLPFLPEDCSDMTFIDMGCNAGLFLKLAENKGFKNIVGVDSDEGAFKKALDYRGDSNYTLLNRSMEDVIEELPVADYTVLANAHYYFPIDKWFLYLDRLRAKTRYCIIVTVHKSELRHLASARPEKIKRDFRDWTLEDEIGEIEGPDPKPRRLSSYLFKSPLIDRVPIKTLDCGNNVQSDFYKELSEGVDPTKTRYYRILRNYRKKWSKDEVKAFVRDKAVLFEDVKKGLKEPLIVGGNRIADGNHRFKMLEYLGYESVLVRWI